MASQVSLPNISPLRSRTNRRAGAFDIWARAGRQLLAYDCIEQARIDRAISEWSYILALLAKRKVARSVQRRSGLARSSNPLCKHVLGHGTHHEIHVGKSAAAVLRGLAIKFAGLVGRQVQLRDHSVHRGDHAAELRHKEHVHDRSRSEREVHWHPRWNDELVDTRDALLGIDEQPFPVERDDLHFGRLVRRADWLERIESI